MAAVLPARPGDPQALGPYRVLGFIGEGGQGSVFLGQAPDGSRVAVKVLHARFAGDAEAVQRFQREVDTARRVAQFCTARVLDMGVAHGVPYVVSQFVDGVSLHETVRAHRPLLGDDLVRLAIATVTALTAIHRAGIVHRDFKPSNVLLAADGPRVIDFGIARALDATSVTSSAIVGSPAYMSPEQIHGGQIGPASDLFSWAGTMVFAATGRPAFGGDSVPAVLNRVLTAEPDLAGVPEPLLATVAACLDKDPARRPTASEVYTALLDPLAGTRPAGEPLGPGRRGAEGSAGRPVTAGRGRSGGRAAETTHHGLGGRRRVLAASAVAALLTAGVAVWALSGDPDGPSVAAATPGVSAGPATARQANDPATARQGKASTPAPSASRTRSRPARTPSPTQTSTQSPTPAAGMTTPPASASPKPKAGAGAWGHREGSWRVNNATGATMTELRPRWSVLFRAQKPKRRDYTVSVDVRLLKGNQQDRAGYGLFLAYGSATQNVRMEIRPSRGSVTMHAYVDGKEGRWLHRPLPDGFDPRAFHTLKVVKTDIEYDFYLDGELVWEATFDVDPAAGGGVALLTTDATAEFRGFRLS